MPWFESRYPSFICGSSSVVERHLAKVEVASSNLVFRSNIWRHSQVVRHGSATPLSPVRVRLPPPFILCRRGGIGRRAGLKIPFLHGSVGSTPTAGILQRDRKSTRLNSSHVKISYAVFCLKRK